MGEPKRILWVEDDKMDVELMLAALEEQHLTNEVAVVRDGEEALDYLYRRGKFRNLSDGNPVLVVLNLKMPKVHGLQVLREIKSDEQLELIPVVMLTSSREERDIIASYRFGANAYMVKPVDYKKFIRAVKELGLFWGILNVAPPGSVKKEG